MNQAPTDSFVRPDLRARFLSFCGKQWPRYLFLGAIGLLVRLPAVQGQLIWDDGYLVRDNPFIKSPLLALEAFRHYLFLDSFSGHYRPVQNLSLMIDYYFWNSDLTGYHLSNILLHVAAGLLLFRLLTLLFRNGGGIWKFDTCHGIGSGMLAAFLISAVWMVHPVHSAAIDYISGRADSLAFLFSAGAWLLVLRGRVLRSRAVKYTLYSAAGSCALLALCSREIACIWLFIFLVYSLAFELGTERKTKFATVICCLAILGAYIGLRHLPQARPDQTSNDTWPAAVRAVLMMRALGDYGRLMIYPANLHMERTVLSPGNSWSDDSAGAEYLSVLGLGVLAALVWGCVKRGAGRRARVLGATWFLSAYLPISNIVYLNATVAEHWLYLPSVGILIFLAGCAFELPIGCQRGLAIVATVAVVAFGLRSFVRSGDWINEETFYKRTFAAGSRSARVAVNLSQIYSGRGSYTDAERILRLVIAQNPDYPIAQNALADVLFQQGKVKEAEDLFAAIEQKSVETRKEYARTWVGALNLARLRHRAKDDVGAIEVLERARKPDPQAWPLVSFESELLRETQGPIQALQLVNGFVRQNWWSHEAWLAEGRLCAESNDVVQAAGALRYAALLDVHDVNALNLLAQILLRENRLDEALSAQRRAVARGPYQPRQYLMLAEVFDKMGSATEAQRARNTVARLKAIAASPQIAAN
jgi:protein O-mannosyl-transferase